jgi:undecaprenyl-diphosphatase
MRASGMREYLDQLLKAVILGIIQGLTEWLPISSTGHLKVAERLLGLTVPLVFDVVLHMGTLAVILAFFRSDVKEVLAAFVHLDFKTDHGRLIPLIVVGVIPTALIGLLLYVFFESALQSLSTIALAFVLCSFVLYVAKFGREKTDKIGLKEALLVGIAQGVAVVPGLSRSGLTIAAALLLGIRRKQAFKFSFLLSVPAVAGALAWTVYREFGELAASNIGLIEVVAGAAAALVVGYMALKLLWRVLAKGKFHLFAFYCWVLSGFLALAIFYGVF